MRTAQIWPKQQPVRALKIAVPRDFYDMRVKTAKAANVTMDVLGGWLLQQGYAMAVAESEMAQAEKAAQAEAEADPFSIEALSQPTESLK